MTIYIRLLKWLIKHIITVGKWFIHIFFRIKHNTFHTIVWWPSSTKYCKIQSETYKHVPSGPLFWPSANTRSRTTLRVRTLNSFDIPPIRSIWKHNCVKLYVVCLKFFPVLYFVMIVKWDHVICFLSPFTQWLFYWKLMKHHFAIFKKWHNNLHDMMISFILSYDNYILKLYCVTIKI